MSPSPADRQARRGGSSRGADGKCAVFPPGPSPAGHATMRLAARLLKLLPRTLVVLARDHEGSGFSPVADFDAHCAYRRGL